MKSSPILINEGSKGWIFTFWLKLLYLEIILKVFYDN